MKNSTEDLVEFVKLVNLPGHPVVPQHAVTEDQLVRGSVPGVGIAVGRGESPQPLTGVEVPDGGHTIRAGAHHLVHHQLGELQALLLLLVGHDAHQTDLVLGSLLHIVLAHLAGPVVGVGPSVGRSYHHRPRGGGGGGGGYQGLARPHHSDL